MAIRLSKATNNLNVGIQTVVEFLQKKGYTVENNLNAKISDEQYALLVKEFSTDKDLRMETEKFLQERMKDRNKPAVPAEEEKPEVVEKRPVKEVEEVETVIPEAIVPKFKSVGKIDLDALNGKKPQVREEQPEPEKTVEKGTPAPQAQEVKRQEVKEIKVETPKVTPAMEKPVEEKPEIKVEPKEVPVAKTEVVEPVTPVAPVVPVEKIQPAPVVEKVQPVSAVQPEVKKETPKPSVTPVEKPLKKEPVVAPVVEKKAVSQETPAKQAKTEDTVASQPKPTEEVKKKEVEIYEVARPEFVSKINVVGHVDLASLNQSTRPKKKTKEEKKKEREEKDKQRFEQRKQVKDAANNARKPDGTAPQGGTPGTPSADAKKKKRNRIQNERVDINKPGSYMPNAGNQNKGADGRPGFAGRDNAAANRSRQDRTKDRARKLFEKPDVKEEDISKQVKDTLARLTTKPKMTGAKYRKEKREQAFSRQMEQANQEQAESKVLKLTEFVTANELANMMNIGVAQVIGTCMSVGIMVSINQRLDAETINLVAEEYGFTTEYISAEVAQAVTEEVDNEEDLQPRAPIVTVMGHVDHGKTSLLDYIRKSNVIAGEAGGITQHIGAYNVKLDDGRRITFLDTPGHEAFTAMRARGAQVTDIAIIIVAADDDVMPQTKEAISHAQAANVPMVFAINKIDKPHADPDKIKTELASMNLLVEEWGGKYQSQDISAKTGLGVAELMEKVLLEAEMLDLKANPNRNATGSIIESTLDKGRGYIATVLVSNGTLKMGDIVLAGTHFGRVKAMFNERNQRIKQAGPAEPALILGLNGAPQAGDTFHVTETEQEAREITNKREQLQREQGLRTQKMLTLDEVGRRIALGGFQELNIIVKGDVDGSIEALSDSLIKLSTEHIQVKVIHKAVGQISESDVSLAAASQAIIIGFQVRPSQSARKFAEAEGVDIRLYSIIYDALEEVKAAMEGMLAPTTKEEVTSTIEVREVFHISKIGYVAGAMVREGKVKRSDKARLVRDGIVIFSGEINALKRFKDDVKEVGTNFECGISLVNCNDIKVGDIIETYQVVEVKQSL